MNNVIIYKVVSRDAWRDAEAVGYFSGASIDIADGYIHFSIASQLVETVKRHFAGQANLLIIGVDTGKLGDALKWESSRGGDLFPHLYGVLPLSATTQAWDLPLGGDGTHQFPSEAFLA